MRRGNCTGALQTWKLKLLWAKSQLDQSQASKKKRDQKWLAKTKNKNENTSKQEIAKKDDQEVESTECAQKKQNLSEKE